MMKSISFFRSLLLSIALLAVLIYLLGTSAPVMCALMEHTAPPAATGLPAAEYRPLCETLTAYLRGERDSCQYTWPGENGATYLAFHDYELSHMGDCVPLFRLARRIACIGMLVCAALTIPLFGRRRQTRRAAIWGYLTALIAVGGLIIWGVVDFPSLFVTFHRLSFDNMGWLLNPATDLLVRLMPTRFFIWYAGGIGGCWVVAVLLLLSMRSAGKSLK